MIARKIGLDDALFLIILSLVLFFFIGCVPDQYEPTEGVWVCEELQIQVSYEPGEDSYMVIDGEKIICACGSDKGVDRLLVSCQDESNPNYHMGELLFSAQIISLSKSELVVYVEASDMQYVFQRTK